MRHNRRTKKLGRTGSERKALLDSLVGSLMTYQQIKTTLTKAKETKRVADHLITLGKTNTLDAKRQVFSYVQNHQLVSKLFNEIAPRFKNRQGGYTRILHLDRRKGDGAELALLELTEKEIKVKETKKKKAKAKDAHDHEHGHEGHEHKHEGDAPKKESKKDKQSNQPQPGQPGFFKNIGKFFRNKGGS